MNYWTTEEKQYFTKYYPKLGPHSLSEWFASKGFSRTPKSLQARAAKTGIRYGIPRGYIAVGELVEMLNGGWSGGWAKYVLDRAKEDKVLFEPTTSDTSGRKVRSVPEEWAWKLVEGVEEKHLNEAKGWWTLQDIANYLNITIDILKKATYPSQAKACRRELSKGMKLLENDRVKGYKNRWLYNPERVKEVLEGFRE